MAAPRHYTPETTTTHGPRKRFTLAESNKALPLVRRIVRDIVASHRRAADMQTRLESAAAVKDTMALQAEMEGAVDRIQEYVEELQAVGCELKDYEVGLIDFPGRHQGRDVCLCWRLDEEKVEYWHEIGSGYAGRRHVTTLEESE